jgi:uncharacterized membrane protein
MMDLTLFVHVFAGTVGLGSGYVALYAAKGSALHRWSGRMFAGAMLTMCAGGLVIAAARNVAPAINIPAALLTAYLVITALTTVRPPATGAHRLALAAAAVAFTVGVVCLVFAFEALASGRRTGFVFPFVMFGGVGLMAAAGDVRLLRSRGQPAASRLARHQWRMSFALLIAAMSFFLGQPDVFPDTLRSPGLRAVPVVAVLATMIYWLRRVRRMPVPGGRRAARASREAA